MPLTFIKNILLKKPNKTNKSTGSSILEYLVFLFLLALIISTLLSLVLIAYRARRKAHMLDAVQETTVFIFNQLVQTAHWSTDCSIDPDVYPNIDDLKLIQSDGSTIEFSVNGVGQLEQGLPLNLTPITSDKITISRFKIKKYSGSVPCLRIMLTVEYDSPKPAVFEDRLIVSLRNTKITIN